MAGALILLAPAIIVGRPFIFWDTPAFYDWGHDIVAAIRQPWPPLSHFPAHRGLWAAEDFGFQGAWNRITADDFQLMMTTMGARSKFYAIPLYLMGSQLSLWAPTIVQALLVSWLLWVTATVVLEARRPAIFLAVIAALTIATTAPFYATFLMPDVFTPLGVLAAALLLCFSDRLTRVQRGGAVLLIIAAILVHTSNLAVLLALILIAIAAQRLLSLPRLRPGGLGLIGVAVAIALAAGAASDRGMEAIFGQRVRTAPFLEGRVIADGPGRSFLKETCERRNFAACIYKDLDVVIPDDIIWPDDESLHGLPQITDPAERRRFLDEELPVVLGTLMNHPLAEIGAAFKNSLRGLVHFRIANTMGVSLRGLLETDDDRRTRVLQIVPNLESCLSWQPKPCDFERPLLYFQFLHYTIVPLALIAIGWRVILLMRRRAGDRETGDQRMALFVLVLVGAVAANGMICGAASGPFERYQARVVWLVPMAAGLLEIRAALGRRQRRPVLETLAPAVPILGGVGSHPGT